MTMKNGLALMDELSISIKIHKETMDIEKLKAALGASAESLTREELSNLLNGNEMYVGVAFDFRYGDSLIFDKKDTLALIEIFSRVKYRSHIKYKWDKIIPLPQNAITFSYISEQQVALELMREALGLEPEKDDD